jgi:hydroxymethylpyrimidine pyrophosphatase-like HAD family hydrolase
MTVRMLASDLDGTLLRSDGTVSDRTRAALADATAAGILVAFVTGRPPRWLHEIADATGHTGVAVASNGAVLYDLAAEAVVSERLLQPELLAALTGELRAAFPQVVFGVEYGGNPARCEGEFATFGSEPAYVHDWEINPALDRRGRPIPPPLVAELDVVISRAGVKLLAKDRDADPDEFLASAAALIAGRATVTHSSRIGLLEIGATGVTKASGLAQVAATHGIRPAEVAAVGDMPNDIPMLEWAGRSYAVRNAHRAVLAAASEVLPANDEDGVAILIDRLLNGRGPGRTDPSGNR